MLGFWFLWKIPYLDNDTKQKKIFNEKKYIREFLTKLKISVIIPARNEEKTLPILLGSLSTQSYKPYEVIVVNDQSTDTTEDIAKKYGVRVINIDNLPEDWLGKPWVCFAGANNSSGNILIFLDADTFLERDGLEKLLLNYIKSQGVITVQPYHKIKNFYENFASYFNLILMGSMNVFTPLQRRLKPIGAFGPCLLCERETYFKIEGHSSAKGEIVEDLEIGKKFIKLKIPVFCFGGKGTINFRMYPDGIKSLVNGFAKSFTIGARSTSIINLIMVILWIAGAFYPLTLIIENIMNLNIIELSVGLTFYFLYAVQLFWMINRIGNFSLLVPICFPVFVLFFIVIFFWSVILTIFKLNIKWKDRNVNRKKKWK
jgi:4,4'-diaponeurosporenoate glycosyltransferase